MEALLDDGSSDPVIRAHSLMVELLNDPGRGNEDPDDPATVQAMQIALRIPKAAPPKRNDVLVAAAQAVVAVCLDPRAAEDGAWRDSLVQWYGHRIRKIARRARGSAWDAVQALPGCTAQYVEHGEQGEQGETAVALARAFIPSAVGEVPHEISKLQIKGTDLARHAEAENRRLKADPQSFVAEVASASTPSIVVDDSLEMTAGKAAAQVGHGSMLLAAAMPADWAAGWARAGFPLNVHEVPRAVFEHVVKLPDAVPVRDSGFTEVAPGSVTVVAVPGSRSF